MKKLIIGLTLLASLPSLAIDSEVIKEHITSGEFEVRTIRKTLTDQMLNFYKAGGVSDLNEEGTESQLKVQINEGSITLFSDIENRENRDVQLALTGCERDWDSYTYNSNLIKTCVTSSFPNSVTGTIQTKTDGAGEEFELIGGYKTIGLYKVVVKNDRLSIQFSALDTVSSEHTLNLESNIDILK